MSNIRIGSGIDVHRFSNTPGSDNTIVLGGVPFPMITPYWHIPMAMS